MKHLLILILMVFCSARAAIPPLPVSVDPTNSTLVWPTNLWTANVAGLTNALDGLLGGGSGSDTNWNGNPIGSGTVTNLAVPGQLVVGTNQVPDALTNIVGAWLNGKPMVNPANGDLWLELIGSSAALAFAPLLPAAINGGSTGVGTPEGDHTSVWSIDASPGTANRGMVYSGRIDSEYITQGLGFALIFRASATNSTVLRAGYLDSVTVSDPTDGAFIQITDGYVFGRCVSNSVVSDTITSNQIDQASWYSAWVHAQTTNIVQFRLLSETGAALWSDTITNNIPNTPARASGPVLCGFRVDTNAPTVRAVFDAAYMFRTTPKVR